MTDQYFRVNTKDSSGKRKGILIELSRQDEQVIVGRKVNRQGDYVDAGYKADGYHDALEVISKACVVSVTELIHDFKYGELVEPHKASQNLPEWGEK